MMAKKPAKWLPDNLSFYLVRDRVRSMQNPASSPRLRRTCPTCNRTVEPGYKFCEACGTRIPALSTCTECGTQFIAPKEYCDWCGAPITPGKVPEPDNWEYPDEETTGPVKDRTSGRGEEKNQEPDTEELLEKYGKEYDVNETLESSRKPKSGSPAKQEAKKPVMGSAQPNRGSSETVDDVLFLSPYKMEVAAKPRLTRTAIIGVCIALAAIIAVVYFIGLPMLTGSGGPGASINPHMAENTTEPEPTIARTILPTLTVTPTPASKALVPLPTQTIPPGLKIYFQVQKSPVTGRILITFAGSAGYGSINSADIKVTHPDGSVATGIIQPLKGINEMILDGSAESDRVEIIALMSDGGTYRVYDELVPDVR